MNKSDFEHLTDVRLEDAELLQKHGRYDGAYYLLGYAIECALKACIARKTQQHDFPPDRRFVEECYTHDLSKLVKAADLQLLLEQESIGNPAFANNWSIVKDWSEKSRYEKRTEQQARALHEAVTAVPHGVLLWVKQFWK